MGKNVGENIHNLGLGDGSLDVTSKVQAIKGKNKKIGLLKKFPSMIIIKKVKKRWAHIMVWM